MLDLGLDVLLKGNNMIRLLQGLWVALWISLVSVIISMPLGILLGIVMTWKIRSQKQSLGSILNLSGSCRSLSYFLLYISERQEFLAGSCPVRLLRSLSLYFGEQPK